MRTNHWGRLVPTTVEEQRSRPAMVNDPSAATLMGMNRTGKNIYPGFETTTSTIDGSEQLTERGLGQRSRRDARRAKNRVARKQRNQNRGK